MIQINRITLWSAVKLNNRRYSLFWKICISSNYCIKDVGFIADKWSPALQIRTVLLSIQALLSAPNPDDPLANDVAEQWKTNEAQAIRTGRQLLLPVLHYVW